MAGRKPKPTQLKIIQGNPGKRPLNKREPKPPTGKPRCPSFLPDEAKAEWRRITSELEEMGLITKADRAALVLYCDAWATWREACEEIADGGAVFSTPKGYKMPSPYVAIRNNAFKQMAKILTEFGLTPSSRSRVAAPEQDEENPFEKFLSQRAG